MQYSMAIILLLLFCLDTAVQLNKNHFLEKKH